MRLVIDAAGNGPADWQRESSARSIAMIVDLVEGLPSNRVD